MTCGMGTARKSGIVDLQKDTENLPTGSIGRAQCWRNSISLTLQTPKKGQVCGQVRAGVQRASLAMMVGPALEGIREITEAPANSGEMNPKSYTRK